MTPEYFLRVREVFEQILERSPEERAALLEELCGSDQQLAAEVQRMLLADAAEESPIDQPAHSQPALSDLGSFEGRRIGPYLIQRQIGRGGMGTVYLAARVDDVFHKQVAIKIVRPTEGAEVLRRFHQERQILAGLDHPNIARLLDGGSTSEGLPYLVMEYVEGIPIDHYCDNHKLTISKRLELFRTVCEAVQYAHQNLVVHRDLKPSNILVTTTGVVKLLDFGIAKLLRNTESAATLYVTRKGLHLMTPEYASPEQVKGETITTATDVYSLGVVLYELLTGHRPYRMRSRVLHEIARIICEEEPSRPSTVISQVEQVDTGGEEPTTITPEYVSQVRDVQVTKLRKRLSGDLDTILLLVLRKEPQRRYSSVEQFREDLERHLAGLPVRAQTYSLWYRTRKFVQRNRLGVAAAAGLGTTLIAMGASLWRAHEEQARGTALQEELTYANRRLGIDQKRGTAIKGNVVRTIPPGWMSSADNDDFAIQLDRKITHSGKATLSIQADGDITRPDNVSQAIRADHYWGKRVRWSAYAKCEGVQQRAALWLRVDARDRILAMDDLQRTPIVGTRDWQQYAVVLDVPKDSVVIRLGVLLVGKGKVWFDDLKLETVGPDVRVTDIWRWASPAYKKEANLALQRYSLTQEKLDRLPGQPVNLQWE